MIVASGGSPGTEVPGALRYRLSGQSGGRFSDRSPDQLVHHSLGLNLVGVLALLHAASNAEVRSLTLSDIDWCHRTISFGERPHPVPIDPVTDSVLRRALAHRETLSTENPHVIVTRATKTRSCPASPAYITHVLDPAGVRTKALRQTRILDLVNRLDPKVAAEVLGMNADGLATYVSDDVNSVLLAGSSSGPNL